jgi:hypothetical protein
METNRRRFIAATAAAALTLAVMPLAFHPKEGYRGVYILRENAWAVSKFEELRKGDQFLLWDVPTGTETGEAIYLATSDLMVCGFVVPSIQAHPVMFWRNNAWIEA